MPYKLRLKEGGEVYEFLSMGELAELCGKSREALKKLTVRGILPESNFRSPKVLINKGLKKGQYIEGYRLYSKEFLVPKLSEYIRKNFQQGKQITLEQRLELLNMFEEERNYFLNL